MKELCIGGFDYLGLARDERVVEAASQAARDYGVSPGGARWSVGWTALHQRLEERLAAFFGAEDVCLHGSGYLGAACFFASIRERHAVVYGDAHVHPSVVLGVRGAGLTLKTYRHLDLEDLERQLAVHEGLPPVVASDAVFSISGEVAPLDDMAGLLRGRQGVLFVDDSHGLFCVGPRGRGVAQAFGLGGEALTITGSMSKALGCYGGCTWGRREALDPMRRGADYGASTVLPFPVVGACLAALDVLEGDPGIFMRLQRSRARMMELLSAKAIPVISDARTPIVTMALAGEGQARRLADHLCRHRLYVKYLDYPGEPRRNLLRLAARACYVEDDFERMRAALDGFDFDA